MPELPEVETIRRELNSKIKNKTIINVEIKVAKMVNLPISEFVRKVRSKKIKHVYRRAKLIVVDLYGHNFLLFHLKMTGQLVYVPKIGKTISGGHSIKNLGHLPNKFSHIIFTFSDGSKLFFNDVRKFGWVRLVDDKLYLLVRNSFGLEPLKNDFTYERFKAQLMHYPNRKIKQVILDQALIAGLGNIYTDESCFCANIKPMRIVKTLKEEEIKKLHRCIPKVLEFAILKKGTSANNYVRTDGTVGGMVPFLKVYGRKGQKCKRQGCKGVIRKIQLNARGTHFCDVCQK
ncbi:DNA-formamidopyrimidine glycosylase [Patescibacteria group bacterium]|nr:DNA-formamidopyrimidine glycosylase [Patescibacteria group bacterium]